MAFVPAFFSRVTKASHATSRHVADWLTQIDMMLGSTDDNLCTQYDRFRRACKTRINSLLTEKLVGIFSILNFFVFFSTNSGEGIEGRLDIRLTETADVDRNFDGFFALNSFLDSRKPRQRHTTFFKTSHNLPGRYGLSMF